jgi:hypothetical protein
MTVTLLAVIGMLMWLLLMWLLQLFRLQLWHILLRRLGSYHVLCCKDVNVVTGAVADSAVIVVAMDTVASMTAAFGCFEDDTVATGAGVATFAYVTVAGAVGICLW